MISSRGVALAAVAAGAVAAAGCGFGPGSASSGTATLTVTRDYGATAMDSASESDPAESETVLRLLDRNTDITTRFGGGFVQSIDGLEGGTHGTRRSDWFFYVNGVESPVGATDVRVHGGDRVWWDYRDWTNAMRVPAVIGSYPQPFAAANGPSRGGLLRRAGTVRGRGGRAARRWNRRRRHPWSRPQRRGAARARGAVVERES